MTQTVTGTGLGTHGSSIGLGSYGPKGSAALGQGGSSVYVNAANGNMVLRQSDGFFSDLGFGLDLFQTYNSRGEQGGSWCFNVQSRLELSGIANQEGSSVTRVDEDVHRSRFIWDVNQQAYRPEEGGTARLTFDSKGWTYSEGDSKTSCHYNEKGQLTELCDKDGHSMIFTYTGAQLSAITDSSGKQKVTWTFANGLLTDATTTSDDVVLHHLHYEYDDHQRLHKISRDLGDGTTYWTTYDYAGDSNRISDIKQSDGTQLHIDYDAEGRVKQLVDGEGRISKYEYSAGQTTLTNALGESWTYFYDAHNRLTGVDGPEHYKIGYHYEGTQLSSIIQGTQVWHFTYNEAGDCITIAEPNGQITQRLYDAEHRLLAETQYQSFDGTHQPTHPKTTRYLYDALGHLLFVVGADGTVTEHRYDAQGQRTSSRCYLRASYGSEQDTLSLDALSQWVAQQKPHEVSLVDYHYDWRGQLTEEIHYSAVTAEGLGIDTHALHTRTLYDAAGRLLEKSVQTERGWSTTTYLYDDLGRLQQSTDNQGHCQRFEYDDAHHRIIQTDANGLQTIRLYDRSGLLLSTQRLLDETHHYGSTTYCYDAAGRLSSETGIDGLSTYFFYDAQGRLQAKVNTLGQLTEYRYNDEGLLVQTHQYATRITTKNWQEPRPTLASIIPQASAKDGITQTLYNAYHQVAYSIDAQGAVIGYTYDAEDRVLSKTAYANRLKGFSPNILLAPDAVTLLPDAKDRSLLYYYDSQGQLQAEINGEGYATEYRYNRLGLLIETCRHKTPVKAPLSGDWASDRPAAHRGDIHHYSLYNAQGLKTADIDGEGYLTEYRYDASGLLQERLAYEHAITPSLNEDSTIETIRPKVGTNDHSTSYHYNDLGQLVKEATQNGLITTYAYDAMGQLILKSRMDATTHTLREQRTRYDVLGRVIQQLDELGCAKLNQPDLNAEDIEGIWQQHSLHYTYDNAGLLLTKTDALQRTTRYFYNEHHQLHFTVSANGAVVETRYNALNQVESIYKYSAFLKSAWAQATTESLSVRMESLKDSRFDEITTYEYNSIGQVIAKHSGTQGQVSSQYNAFGELELSTQARDAMHNKASAYAYDRRGLLLTQIEDVGGLARKTATTYDAFGWVKSYEDGNTHTVGYELNKRGEQTTIINASNQSKDITYDAFGRILSETDCKQKKVVAYTYDDRNNSLTLTNPLTKFQVTTYFNALGDKVALTDANGNRTEFQYDERGLLLRVDSPEKSFKEYHYDALGQLLWQTDAGGHEIAYTFDAQGHMLTKTVDPKGLKITTTYQYDAIGRQLQVTEHNGCIKQFIYDTEGRLTQSCIDPKGLNLITQFTYDAQGQLLLQTELNPKGKNKVTAYEWDTLGRRSATISDPDDLNLTTRYQYDANDNLICQTDANQHSTHYLYDANNQCRYQIDARGVVTEHVYSLNGKEVQTIRYANRITALLEYTDATLKDALIKDSNKDQHQFRTFDGEGRMLCAYNAQGYAILYEYDGNGNVIKTIRCAKAVSLDALKRGGKVSPDRDGGRCSYFAYDGLNQLRFQSEHNGCITESQYDASGQLHTRIQYAQGINVNKETVYSIDYFQTNLIANTNKDKTTRYTYDQAGRLSLEVSPLGVAKSYQYNGLNQVVSCTRYATLITTDTLDLSTLQKSPNDRTNFFLYDAAGRETYRVSPEGQVIERRYDSVGNVLTQLAHQSRIHLDEYSAEGIAQALLDQEGAAPSSTYEYDAAGRLLTETNANQRATQYAYDANGNVASKTDANKAVWTYSYNETNQLIETTSPEVSVMNDKVAKKRAIITRTTYDSFGNVSSEIRDATGIKQTRQYEYDTENQRIKTIYLDVGVNNAQNLASSQRQELQQTLTETIRYNAFGEVIASSDKAGHWKHFAYNSQGRLIYSVDTRGGLTQYTYDTLGRVKEKTLHYNPIILATAREYSLDAIEKAHRGDTQDRHEFYKYNQDDQLIESSRDAVRTYNATTNKYSTLRPTTQTTYNAFGEVVQAAQRLNETDWARTTSYYDKDGHQTAVLDAENYLTTYTLNAFGETQSMTEHATRMVFSNLEDYTIPETHTKDRTVTYIYDALGQVTSKTLKQVTVSSLDSKKQLKTETRDLVTSYSYDGLGHLILTVDAKGSSAYCYYDALGQLTAKIGPQVSKGRAATIYSYDALGHLVETHQWANGALAADTEQFVLNAADTKKDIITNAAYDAQGLLLSETDGMQHTIYYSYDANGNLARSFQTLTQINNGILVQDKRFSYDSENHLLQTATFKNKSNSVQKIEEAQYNIFGEVTAKGIDGQYNVHVDYDQSGRVWRSNTQGYYQIYVYDLADHVTQIVTSASGFHPADAELGTDLSESRFEGVASFNQGEWRAKLQRQNNTYDALGHLLMQSKEYSLRTPWVDNKGELTETSQSQIVDRWGNMLSFTNALGYKTLYEYNDFNSVIRQELSEVSSMDTHGVSFRIKPVNQYAYDALGQVIALTDANGHIATKDYDAEGHLISETDAKGASRTKQYNLLGQLESATNERLHTTNYIYDNANRLIEIKTPKTKQNYQYDEAGQLLLQKNDEGDTTYYEFDALGNQVKRQNTHGYLTYFEYDDFGHKVKEIGANGSSQTWAYGADGRLRAHTDLGGNKTTYEYNTNGLLLHESSTKGKSIRYFYQGDGQLIQYADEARHEIVNYNYDAEGQMRSKESSRSGSVKDNWLRETDHYEYDALGRLVQVLRRNPEDIDTRFPDKDDALLSVNYDYDQVGNIRHTKVETNYTGRHKSSSEDYYLYDDNNRMTTNKGQLVNGHIMLSTKEGSSILTYDDVGNIATADKYEHNALQHYAYTYTKDNLLELIQKNNGKIQFKKYDNAGRVTTEVAYNNQGATAQTNIMIYKNGLLTYQETRYGQSSQSPTWATYEYYNDGSLQTWAVRTNGGYGGGGSTLTHSYTYEAWDSYQQKTDTATQEADGHNTTYGISSRVYDENGLLKDAIDQHADNNGVSNSAHYWSSSVDGMRARNDKDGRTSYLTVAGKTIGDLHIDHSGNETLNIYSGFTPTGSQHPGTPWGAFSNYQNNEATQASFQRAAGDVADGTLPEAPQDTLGTHTLQMGDSLPSIALQVYGDSSLWYLIADANGILSKDAVAGNSNQLRIGQILNLPAAATGQHHTNATHRVLNANQMIGNTSATTAIPMPIAAARPPKPKHHSIWATIIVAVVAVVTTVLTAGILTAGTLALGPLFTAGLAALSGGIAGATLAGSMAVGFTAGFIGSIASQGAANALGMQKGLDITGTFINAISAAATAGVGNVLGTAAGGLKKTLDNIKNLAINQNFSITSSALMMEENAVSQGLNIILRKNQHFDWEELGISGVTGGILGSKFSEGIGDKLNGADHNTGFLKQELHGLTQGGIHSITTGGHFDAAQVLVSSLGSSIGSAITNIGSALDNIGHNIHSALENVFSIHETSNEPLENIVPIKDNSLPANKNSNESLTYGSEIQEYTGYAIYNDSRKIIGGEGPLNFRGMNGINIVPYRDGFDDDTLLIYGLELSEFAGDVIYNDSDRFNGKGVFRKDIIPLKPIIPITPISTLKGLNPSILFIADIYPFAYAASQESGLSLKLMLAQAAHETGWGKGILPGTNNLYNIKADKSWKGSTSALNALEQNKDGSTRHEPSLFRKYPNREASVNDRVKFLSENKRYHHVFDKNVIGNARREAKALYEAGYATDREYVKKVMEVTNCPSMKKAIKFAREHYGY